MVLSHLFPKVWFVSSYLRDKNRSLHSEAFKTSSDSEILVSLWQWWCSHVCPFSTEEEGTQPWLATWITAKHREAQSVREWGPHGTELPVWLQSKQASRVEENLHFSKKTNQHSVFGFSLYLERSQQENDRQNFPNSHTVLQMFNGDTFFFF